MNLVAYSLKTKGPLAFSRRLGTVFTRFGFSEGRTRRSLQSMLDAVRPYQAAPTFFIPARVLGRNPELIRTIEQDGAEIGIHGFVHNDYRTLPKDGQEQQTRDAVNVFERERIPFEGFRNPYLGWDEASLEVFRALGFGYDSNEAVLHDVLDVKSLEPALADSFARSLDLFQAIPYTEYNLRPHVEDNLARIPLSIPDDEMLFDRLRITNGKRLGDIWSQIMRRVYDAGGIYVLNLHPERGTLARSALDRLLFTSSQQELPVWVARLCDVAAWWRERATSALRVTAAGADHWRIRALGSPRLTVLTRNVAIEDAPSIPWPQDETRAQAHDFTVSAPTFPGVAVSPRTAPDAIQFLREQGYPMVNVDAPDASRYGVYLDLPDGLGATRRDRQNAASELVRRIEHGATPLARIGQWPDGRRAALSITGDIDSITIQDFFLRIIEVRRYATA